MSQKLNIYQWSRRDKLLYTVTLVPFLVAFVGAAYLLATVSVYLTVVLLFLYLLVNLFQAGCCVGCPYRGGWCPAVFGIYLANLISAVIYKEREFEPRFFKVNANLAEISLGAALLFPIYWLLSSGWFYLVGYVLLYMVHAVLFFPAMCPKCGYNDTCPGGQSTLKLLRRCRNVP